MYTIRLEKRVLVPLPEEKARETLFKKLLCDRVTENSVNYTAIAEATNGMYLSSILL